METPKSHPHNCGTQGPSAETLWQTDPSQAPPKSQDALESCSPTPCTQQVRTIILVSNLPETSHQHGHHTRRDLHPGGMHQLTHPQVPKSPSEQRSPPRAHPHGKVLSGWDGMQRPREQIRGRQGQGAAMRAPASSQEGLGLILEAGWVTVVTLR